MPDETITSFETALVICDDCGELLDGKALDHALEGFGHYRHCCACYEIRQRGESCEPKVDVDDDDELEGS